MKKIFILPLLVSLLFLPQTIIIAQPPPPPSGHGENGNQTNGAPIGGGIGILLSLGAVYGGKKLYTLYTEERESQEE